MKYKGRMWYEGYVDPDGTVTDAVVRGNRISIDWQEGSWKGHLAAESTDGIHFEGVCDYTPQPEPNRFTLKKYTSGRDILLFGTWHKVRDGEEGTWVFELSPD